jgi:UDP-glucose 4-epimerase
VVDLAKGHTAALKKFETNQTGFLTYNLGTGKGNSVLEVLKMYSKVIGR